MRENNKKDAIKRFRVPLIITCPVCGFTFKLFDPSTGKKNQKCPICNNYLKEYSRSRVERFYIDMI
jgi:rubrerythrin